MNATQTAQSLLSLPSGVSAPDPYAVLGLRPGESDTAKIAAAVKSVVARLNEAKGAVDPATWNQAAIWVKESRRILTDPALKARLDQKITDSSTSEVERRPSQPAPPSPVTPPLPPTAKSPAAAAIDPLAAFLPGQPATSLPTPGPLPSPAPPPGFAGGVNSAFRPGSVPISPAAVQPPGIPQPPSAFPQPGSGQTADSSGTSVEVARELEAIGKPKSPTGRRRKKRFPWASLVLVGLTLASIGGIVALVVYLNKNPGGITIALQTGADGAVPVAGTDFAVAPPVKRDDSPPDPIMGRLAPANQDRNAAGEKADDWLANLPTAGSPETDIPTAADNPAMPTANPAMPTANPAMPAANPAMPTENPAMPTENPATPTPADSMPDAATITDPSMANIPEGTPPPTEVPNMAEIPGVTEPTAEQLETANVALEKAKQVLKAAKWDEMNAAASAADQAAATQEQKTQASQLVQLAELATYYHVGVEKALEELDANETFNVTDQLQISVVEIGPTKVTLRFNGRNKEYPRFELPLVVVHKIASFTMPIDSPATKIAAQAYQSLAPITTPQYREQAIKTLQGIPPQPDDVDPADLVAAIRQLFPE